MELEIGNYYYEYDYDYDDYYYYYYSDSLPSALFGRSRGTAYPAAIVVIINYNTHLYAI